jgi:hypothetical protein
MCKSPDSSNVQLWQQPSTCPAQQMMSQQAAHTIWQLSPHPTQLPGHMSNYRTVPCVFSQQMGAAAAGGDQKGL